MLIMVITSTRLGTGRVRFIHAVFTVNKIVHINPSRLSIDNANLKDCRLNGVVLKLNNGLEWRKW